MLFFSNGFQTEIDYLPNLLLNSYVEKWLFLLFTRLTWEKKMKIVLNILIFRNDLDKKDNKKLKHRIHWSIIF